MISNRMKNLHPYVPGEQPKDRVYIKLNANENPYAPSTKVQDTVVDFVKNNPMKLALYPDPDSLELHAAIAEMLNKTGGVLCNAVVDGEDVKPSEKDKIPFTVTPEMVYSGNGSDEVLSFVFYAFFDSGKKLVLPEFTYSFYPVYAGFYNIETDVVPMKKDWSLDTNEMLNRASKNGSGLIFANPNAPSGIGLSRAEIREMLLKADKDEIFVVDEAYCDFGGESCIPLLEEFKNLLIVRTFSKSLCGAGMRLGYIVANPELINYVTTVKNSLNHFPIDAVAQIAGVAACKNPAYYCECAKKVAEERETFQNFLSEKGWEYIPSRTNFVLVRNPKVSGEQVYQKIKKEGILVRHFSTKGIEDYVRITIGTKEQMDALKKAMEAI
ncbi:MAG: histidinol-phosphate transaminase [Spirochaetia bacterium]|nr:histidinol-phosphate transaminase [Spirochaetia bacterium]